MTSKRHERRKLKRAWRKADKALINAGLADELTGLQRHQPVHALQLASMLRGGKDGSKAIPQLVRGDTRSNPDKPYRLKEATRAIPMGGEVTGPYLVPKPGQSIERHDGIRLTGMKARPPAKGVQRHKPD